MERSKKKKQARQVRCEVRLKSIATHPIHADYLIQKRKIGCKHQRGRGVNMGNSLARGRRRRRGKAKDAS